MKSLVEQILNGDNIHQSISEAMDKPAIQVKNIIWDVDVDDVVEDIYQNYSEMTDKECAEALGITKEDLEELLDNDTLDDFIQKKFYDDENFGGKWFDLPTEYFIPAHETTEAGVADWLSDELGWTIKDLDTFVGSTESVVKESPETVTVEIYGDDVPGCESIDDLVDYFRKKGLKVDSFEGDVDYGWDMRVTGQPRALFFAICDKVPGYNSDSVNDFIDSYRIDESVALVEAEDLTSNKKFDLVDVFGHKALYTPNRFRVDGPIDGIRLYAYDVKSLPDDPESFGTLETHVLQGRNGSLLFLKSIKTPVDIHDDISFTGDQISVPEFIAIYGTQKKTA